MRFRVLRFGVTVLEFQGFGFGVFRFGLFDVKGFGFGVFELSSFGFRGFRYGVSDSRF